MQKINLKNVQIMGILNLTPDSFSDGGKITNTKSFLSTAIEMLNNGATILDLGAEASGPNSVDVNEQEEANRLLPYLIELQKLKPKYNFKISVDTYKPATMELAINNGADIINDITALRAAPPIPALINSDCQLVLMYSKDSSARTTKTATEYKDIIHTLFQFFEERITFCEQIGIKKTRLILDPGMGAFISTIPTYSFEILERLQELKSHFQLPILIGTSKKSFLPFPLNERLIPSIATSLLASFNGADILRVHDVQEHNQALKTFSTP